MFDLYCPRCASRRLIFPSQITGVDNDTVGIVVHFECWCGTAGAWNADTARVSWPAEPLATRPIAA
jgi:hypothetical protein